MSPGDPALGALDDSVNADAATGAASVVDALEGVLVRLHALASSPHDVLVVRVIGGQRAAACLAHEFFDALCQGNHSSVVRTGKPETSP